MVSTFLIIQSLISKIISHNAINQSQQYITEFFF